MTTVEGAKTTAEVCEEFGILPPRVKDLIQRRKLNPPKKFGPNYVWTPADRLALRIALGKNAK